MTQFLRYAAKSDVGIVRRDNEDSGYAGRTLLVVADGMGGHAAGELASSTAVATLAELDSEDLPAGDVLTALDDALLTSAERIAQFIEADPSRAGMGTTLTAVLWRGGRIALIHVGDSRAYLLRDGRAQPDHPRPHLRPDPDRRRADHRGGGAHPSQAQPDAAGHRRHRRPRGRDLHPRGPGRGPLPAVQRRPVRRRDRRRHRSACWPRSPDPTAAVTELVDLALAAGAPDNVTAVVADVVEVADADADLESALGGPVVVGRSRRPAQPCRAARAAVPRRRGPGDDAPALPPPGGPAVTGGLAARSQTRARSEDASVPGAGGATSGSAVTGGVGGSPPVRRPPDRSVRRSTPATCRRAPPWLEQPATSRERPRSPEPGWLRRHWRGVSAAAAVAAVLVVGALGFLWWLSSQWFVGANAQYVAVHQGIPQQVAGVPLNRVATTTALPVDSLPYYDQAQLEGTLDAATRGRGAADRDRPRGQVRRMLLRSSRRWGAPWRLPGAGSGTTLPSASPTLHRRPPPRPPGTLR